MPAAYMDHGGKDPAQLITSKIGNLSDVEVFYNKVLCGIYVRPEKTVGNVFLPDSIRDEDLYQGKAAIVLKVGPTAFVDDGQAKFNGQNISPGDWIVFRPSNGLKMKINKTDCVLLQDVQIELRIPAPDVVY